MKMRLTLCVLFVCLTVGGVTLASWWMTPDPGVTTDNFERLRAGMSSRAASAILGRPPDSQAWFSSHPAVCQWNGDACRVSVLFTDGRATEAFLRSADGTVVKHVTLEPSIFQQARRWLGF